MLRVPNLGYWPDPRDKRDIPFESLRAQVVPPKFDLEHRRVSIPNQLGTSSCTGKAIRQGFGVEEARTNPLREPISASGVYFNGRAEHGVEKYDVGSFLRTGIKSIIRFGPIRERDWPFDPVTINRRPPWRAYRNAHDSKGPKGYYRIAETGSARVDAIRRAIAAEHPVVFGTTVTKSFMSGTGSWHIERPSGSDPVVGGHAMCLLGYDEDLFRVANSWGTGWRDGGLAWMRESYLTWEQTRDLWVIVV